MKRYRRSRRRNGGSGRNGSLLLVGILILAVAAGYVGTKFFLAPYILEGKLWTPQARSQDQSRGDAGVSGPGIISGQQQIKDAGDLGAAGAAIKTPSGEGENRESALKEAPSGQAAGQTPAGQGAEQTPTGQAAGEAPAGQGSGQTPAPAAGAKPEAAGGFAVQFGSFSTKGAAEKAASQLKEKGIAASIWEKDGAYKVLGESFPDKEKARDEAEKRRTQTEDVFVIAL